MLLPSLRVIYSLMDRQRLGVNELAGYLVSVPHYADFNRPYLQLDRTTLANLIVGDMERSGAVRRRVGFFISA